MPKLPAPRRDFSGWVGRPAWWLMEGGISVYATLMRVRGRAGQRLELHVWDGNLCLSYFASRVRRVAPGEPVYACGRQIPVEAWVPGLDYTIPGGD